MTSWKTHARCILVCAAVALLASCGEPAPPDADEIIAGINEQLEVLNRARMEATFALATDVTEAHSAASSAAETAFSDFLREAQGQARALQGQPMSEDSARALRLLAIGLDASPPADPGQAVELAMLQVKMDGAYNTAKACAPDGSCRDYSDLARELRSSRDPARLQRTWIDWHDLAIPMRSDYQRFVTLANQGARDAGFDDLGELWRSNHDMDPEDLRREVDRLWGQIEPLYLAMHCYVGGELQQVYGRKLVADKEPVPAQLFGNMWAQNWNAIDDVTLPYPGIFDHDVTAALIEQGYDGRRLVQVAEDFYVSLGLAPMPTSFWDKSMFMRPTGREAKCTTTSYHVDGDQDLRLSACYEPREDRLVAAHEIMAGLHYYLERRDQPYLFREGSSFVLSRAMGGMVGLSLTDQHYARLGLAKVSDSLSQRARVLVNRQMRSAMDHVAFMPFGIVVDKWRWDVFSGAIPAEKYNEAWWDLRREYQRVAPPVARGESYFDPGAKYHVAGNTPYVDYFLAYVLQFQLHEALCKSAGHRGSLHECSIYGNAAAGARLQEAMQKGGSRPLPELLMALTGNPRIEADALLAYYQPLMTWLQQRNADRSCH